MCENLKYLNVLDIAFLRKFMSQLILCMKICKTFSEEIMNSLNFQEYREVSMSEEYFTIVTNYIERQCTSLSQRVGKLINQRIDLLITHALRSHNSSQLDARTGDCDKDRFRTNYLQSMQSECIMCIFSSNNTFPIQSYDIEFSSLTQFVLFKHEIHSYCNYDNRIIHIALVATKRKFTQAITRSEHVRFIVDSGCSNHITNADEA
jgi:hypothetical protein